MSAEAINSSYAVPMTNGVNQTNPRADSRDETFAKFLFPRQPKPQTQVFGCFRLFPPLIAPDFTQTPP